MQMRPTIEISRVPGLVHIHIYARDKIAVRRLELRGSGEARTRMEVVRETLKEHLRALPFL